MVNASLQIQSAWLLYDVISDKLKDSDLSKSNLQLQRSIIRFTDLEVSNMTTAEKKSINLLLATSELELIKSKAMVLLEGRIAIENEKNLNSQKLFRQLTEIALTIIAIFSFYDPVMNIIEKGFKGAELWVLSSLCYYSVLFI